MDSDPHPARLASARHQGPRNGPPVTSEEREPGHGRTGATVAAPKRTAPNTDEAAMVTALWCPHCKTPFVGAVNPADASFVHVACGGRSVLDLDLLDTLAAESWFWRRYRERLRSQG